MADANQVFEAEAAVAGPARFNNTSMQQVEQIVSVSQHAINSMLKARFNSMLKKKKDRRLREFKHAIADYGEINAVLDAPRVQMVVPDDPNSVMFFLNFASGSFEYYVGFGKRAELRTQNIAGWSIAFKVGFNLKKLRTVPNQVANRITLLKPNAYSASRLLLVFSEAAAADVIWDKEYSSCPGLEENQALQFASMNMFKEYMKVYMQWLSTGPFSVLGYAIRVEDSSAAAKLAAPSFPPTAVKCRTHAYNPHTNEFKDKFSSTGDLDSFVFLEMTQNHGFPETDYNPTKAGNWITGHIASSLTMSRSIFFESFFCKRFEMLNLECINLANSAYWWVHERKLSGTEVEKNGWILSKDSKPTSAPWTTSGSGATFYQKFENKNRMNHIFKGQWRDNLTATIDNKLTYKAGSDVLEFTVIITVDRDEWNGGHGGGVDSSSSGKTTLSWTGSVTLGNIKEGELAVDVHCPSPSLQHKYSSSTLAWHESIRRKYEVEAESALKSGIEGLDALEKDIAEAFNQQPNFVFPGAGDFFMKKAAFNASGDLLLELSFQEKAIEIDDDFHLQVEAEGISELHKKWLKVEETSAGTAAVLLVNEQNDATKFQLDNGRVVVDEKGFPTGRRSTRKPISGGDGQAQQFVFVAKEDIGEDSEKFECSTTGSAFAYAVADDHDWMNMFTMDAATGTQ
ncbi:hypothetical protein ACLX1H_005233 [Fusarium chlamydosporum]